jgi:hypothetical protein
MPVRSKWGQCPRIVHGLLGIGAIAGAMKGSVRKHRTAGGTWSYRLDLGIDADGRREQKQVGGFRTKKAAQAALNEALAGLQRGTYVAPSRQTVAGFLELWIDGARSELAITAWTNYGEIIRRYVVPYIGAKRLVDLSPLDVKAMHAALLDHGRRDGTALAVASVQLAHRVLHRALAVRWNLIPTNPATGARVPKGERKEMSVWTAEEASTFLDAVADDRLVALWTVALHTVCGAASSPGCGGRTSTSTPRHSPSRNNARPPATRLW